MHNLLIIDDDEFILDTLKHILSKQPMWNVYTFSDPERAMEMVNLENISLIICDYRMPYMTGVEFLVQAKQKNPHAIRIILSGNTDFDGLEKAINEAGIYRFIHKPVDPKEFINVIEQALQIHDLEKENRRLTEQVKKQQDELARHEQALKKFESEHPAITKVDFDPDGSIILDLNSDI